MSSQPQEPSPETAVVPYVPLSVARPPKVVMDEAIEAAECLKRVLDHQKDKVILNGQRYLKFEDWQTCARFYGVTVKVRDSKPVKFSFGEQEIIGFSATADAILVSTGQAISSAEAMCLNDESKWRSRPKYEYQNGKRVRVGMEPVPLFQLRSMAQTRACAKALRNVMAWVVVLAGYAPTPAEELTETEPSLAHGNCYDCGFEIYEAEQIAATKKRFKVSLCKGCVTNRENDAERQFANTVNDPNLVKKSVEQVEQKRAQILNGRVRPAV